MLRTTNTVTSTSEMLEELHAGRIHSAHDLAKGNLTMFTEDSLEG